MLSEPDAPSFRSPSARVLVVGAGVGGLVAALLLAARGCAVTVVEKAEGPGGKLREVIVEGRGIDSGPTVFTMRWVFDAIFRSVGARIEDFLQLTSADILARHAWQDGTIFDLHADPGETTAAITRLFGAGEADGFRAFSQRSGEVFQTLNKAFVEHPAPSPLGLTRSVGLAGLGALSRIEPFTPLASVIGRYFRDARLRQLFGRYATYCGASPFAAPGPLMLIAHVERLGVWLVEGGLVRIAAVLEQLARERGVAFRYRTSAASLITHDGRARGVKLDSGETLESDAVVFNGDPAALFSGYLGPAARRAVPGWKPSQRSLSALTWSIHGVATGFPLAHHTVFFSGNYAREFDDILLRGILPEDPTIYVCAQDRDAAGRRAPSGPERLFILVNAPARADSHPISEAEIVACEKRVMARLAHSGLTVSAAPAARVVTGPNDFSAMFPGTGGALYGRASHGWASSFQRPGARTAIPGLYLAGGGVHPGPGVPMAALSGRNAAAAAMADLASTAGWRPAAMPGGISTRSARTAATR